MYIRTPQKGYLHTLITRTSVYTPTLVVHIPLNQDTSVASVLLWSYRNGGVLPHTCSTCTLICEINLYICDHFEYQDKIHAHTHTIGKLVDHIFMCI